MKRLHALAFSSVLSACTVISGDGAGSGGPGASSTGGEYGANGAGGGQGVTASGVTASGPAGSGATMTGGTSSAVASGPGGTGNKQQDAETLHQAAERLRELGNRSEWTLEDNSSPSVGQVVPWLATKLAKQEQAQRVAAQARPVLAALRARYLQGAGQDESDVLFREFESLDIQQVQTDFTAITNILGYVDQAPAMNAQRCAAVLRMSGTDRSYIQGLNEMFRSRAVDEARTMLEICPRFQPDDAQVQRAMGDLRPQVESVLAEFREAEMAAARSRNWEANVGGVSAGAPSQLARTGLDFLRAHQNWGGNTERAVQVRGLSVRGDWFVAERDILGQPTKWGLPVHAGVTSNTVAPGLARVYELSLITTSPQKSPPFGDYRVGNSWQILADRVR